MNWRLDQWLLITNNEGFLHVVRHKGNALSSFPMFFQLPSLKQISDIKTKNLLITCNIHLGFYMDIVHLFTAVKAPVSGFCWLDVHWSQLIIWLDVEVTQRKWLNDIFVPIDLSCGVWNITFQRNWAECNVRNNEDLLNYHSDRFVITIRKRSQEEKPHPVWMS